MDIDIFSTKQYRRNEYYKVEDSLNPAEHTSHIHPASASLHPPDEYSVHPLRSQSFFVISSFPLFDMFSAQDKCSILIVFLEDWRLLELLEVQWCGALTVCDLSYFRLVVSSLRLSKKPQHISLHFLFVVSGLLALKFILFASNYRFHLFFVFFFITTPETFF